MNNPFTFGNPIRDPAHFFGRDTELRQIVSRLLSSAHESTSIVGERRIGKTSLLLHLSNDNVASSLGLTPERFCLIYIDFQGLTDITPRRFWQRVLRKMARSICQLDLMDEITALEKLDSFDLFDLEDLWETIADHGLTVALLLDEFEYVTQNPNFGPDFFGGLRALAIHHNLPLVTATRRELVDLCHSDEIKGSPFFNIFASVVLRPFSREEIVELATGYLAETGLSTSLEEQELLLRLGGGHPFYAQIAGYYLVEAKLKCLSGDQLTRQVTSDFDGQADPHFHYLWSHCQESEKITLLAVIALNRQKPSKKTLPNLENLGKIYPRAYLAVPELLKRGLLVADPDREGCCQLLSTSLERWIAREISTPPDSEETQASVEDWLRTGGREVVEPVKNVLPRIKKKYWPLINTVMRELSFELAGAATYEFLIKMLV